MAQKKYMFYESDPTLQELYDELVRNRQLSATMHRLAINGLGKDITKTQQSLKKRLTSMKKVDKLYKSLKDKEQKNFETTYAKYKLYRKNLIDGELQYVSRIGLEWIEKHAKGLRIDKKDSLEKFEQRYTIEEKK